MSLMGRHSIILDALKQKIRVAKHELERYKDDYTNCQRKLQQQLEAAERSRLAAQQRAEHELELVTQQLEQLSWQLDKSKQLANEADRMAQCSEKRAAQLSERLQQSEQQLELSGNGQVLLQLELGAAAQNLHCVERAFEHSAQQVHSLDCQLGRLQQRLRESERRAELAEATAEQLQHAAEYIEERYEQRWRDKLHKYGLD
ncbi:tropomyosin isoforms c/e-like [Drosophila busckii]|uniref:tropomyosin isoforms c/e-like n=1 Tax=Drosophila busckii TaxID=30019 RepID=UPI00083F0438|nr:tropomyosin isoforms c/e-like [Drosophila busckii]